MYTTRTIDRPVSLGEIIGGRTPERLAPGRKCKNGCGTTLRQTNTSKICSVCSQVKREEDLEKAGKTGEVQKSALRVIRERRENRGTRIAFTIL